MKLSEFLENKEIRLAFYAFIVSVVVSFVFPILGYLHKVSLDSFNLGYKSVIGISWLADFDFSGSELIKLTNIYTYTYPYMALATVLSIFSLIGMVNISKIADQIILFKEWRHNKNIKFKKSPCYLLFITIIRISICLFFFIISLTLWSVFYLKNIENILFYILCVVLISTVIAIIFSLVLVLLFYKYGKRRSNGKTSIDGILIFTCTYTVLTIISVMAIGLYSGAYTAEGLKNSIINGDKKMITLKSSPDTEIYVIRCEAGNCVGLQVVQETKELKTVFFKMDDIKEYSI